ATRCLRRRPDRRPRVTRQAPLRANERARLRGSEQTGPDPTDQRDRGAMTDRYDIVIVGGGHNGLTAAFYLARAGLRTLVLERRAIVGGACGTDEIAPGARGATTSYIASMLRPEIVADLGLAERGLRMVPCEP